MNHKPIRPGKTEKGPNHLSAAQKAAIALRTTQKLGTQTETSPEVLVTLGRLVEHGKHAGNRERTIAITPLSN